MLYPNAPKFNYILTYPLRDTPFERSIEPTDTFTKYVESHTTREGRIANIIKIHSISLPDESIKDKLYDFIEYWEVIEMMESIIDNFNDYYKADGFSATFEGRSCGWIELHTPKDILGQDINHVLCNIILDFDRMCEDVVASYVEYATTHKMEWVDEVVTQKVQVAVLIQEEQEDDSK